jgi:hypothetical protein
VGHQLLAVVERSAGKGFGGQDREPDFDLIEPGRLCRREMEMDVGVASKPAVVLGLMGVEIIEDDVDLPTGVLGDDGF